MPVITETQKLETSYSETDTQILVSYTAVDKSEAETKQALQMRVNNLERQYMLNRYVRGQILADESIPESSDLKVKALEIETLASGLRA